jgi:hypothetical protein
MMKSLADVAQLVEHSLGKGEVIGSIPIISSRLDGAALGLVSVATAKRCRNQRKDVIGSRFILCPDHQLQFGSAEVGKAVRE